MAELTDGSSVGVCERSATRYRPPSVLSLKQRLFIDAYLSCGQNGRQAYLKLHPTAKATTADVNASKLLALTKVQAEIAHRVRYSFGITKEQIEEDLLWVRDQARAKGDLALVDSNAMNRAKLAGFLVEKRETRDVTEHDNSAIRDLVSRSMRPLIGDAASDAVGSQ